MRPRFLHDGFSVRGILAVVFALFLVGCAAVPQSRSIPGFTFLSTNAQGYSEYRHVPTGVIFVLLPGGKFSMGSPESEDGHRDDEGPVHEVTLSAFLIGKCELTQGVWEKVMGSAPSIFTQGGDYPVGEVSWEDCQAFCRKTGLKLPSEAQWEYACRAGTSGPYAGTGRLEEMGWYNGNSGSNTHPVGEKKPNGFGLHDMHGNVWEWCEDVHDSGFYSKPESRGRDPLSAAGSVRRVFRGGSLLVHARYCRSAFRYRHVPAYRYRLLGFRPAFFPLS